MNDIKLKIEKEHYAPKENIQVSLHWDLMDVAENIIEVHLFWYTEGRGDEDMEIIETQEIKLNAKSGSKDLIFVAPLQPYSFSGKYIALTWAIEAVMQKSKISALEIFYLTPFHEKIIL